MSHDDAFPSPSLARETLARQLAVAWQLTTYHLQDLGTEECLRRPAGRGLHVHRGTDGTWRAQWPEHERYELGTEAQLAAASDVHWPFEGRPLADLFAWANTELAKSAAEIGYARFLLAVTPGE